MSSQGTACPEFISGMRSQPNYNGLKRLGVRHKETVPTGFTLQSFAGVRQKDLHCNPSREKTLLILPFKGVPEGGGMLFLNILRIGFGTSSSKGGICKTFWSIIIARYEAISYKVIKLNARLLQFVRNDEGRNSLCYRDPELDSGSRTAIIYLC